MTPAERTRAILAAVATAEGVSLALLTGPNRDRRAGRARMLAAWLLRERLGVTQESIGAVLRRDRSSISQMLDRAAFEASTNPDFLDRAAAIAESHQELLA